MRPERHHYGPARAQVADLWRPPAPSAPPPVVVLVHGGDWRGRFTRQLMRALAVDVARRGWAAWNVEYRRLGLLGGSGGWPATLLDVAAAVDHLATLPDLDLQHVVVCGHSTGGQLALWAAARRRLPEGVPGAAPRLAPQAAVSLAGILDLRRAAALGLGGDGVRRLLGGTPEEVGDRYELASPSALLPLRVPQLLVHGLADEVVPPSLSEDYAASASAAGDTVEYVPLPSLGHLAMIDPDRAGWAVVTGCLAGWFGGAGRSTAGH